MPGIFVAWEAAAQEEVAMRREQFSRELKRRLQDAFGQRLKGLLIYGSEARGEASEGSDDERH